MLLYFGHWPMWIKHQNMYHGRSIQPKAGKKEEYIMAQIILMHTVSKG